MHSERGNRESARQLWQQIRESAEAESMVKIAQLRLAARLHFMRESRARLRPMRSTNVAGNQSPRRQHLPLQPTQLLHQLAQQVTGHVALSRGHPDDSGDQGVLRRVCTAQQATHAKLCSGHQRGFVDDACHEDESRSITPAQSPHRSSRLLVQCVRDDDGDGRPVNLHLVNEPNLWRES